MNLWKYLLGGSAALVLGVGLIASADAPTTNPSTDEPKPNSHVRVPAPYNLLPDLTDDQISKIKDIHAEINDEKKALQQKENSEIDDVLTDDQKNEIKDIESKQAMEKKAAEDARRAKQQAEKAAKLKDLLNNGAATQPSDLQ